MPRRKRPGMPEATLIRSAGALSGGTKVQVIGQHGDGFTVRMIIPNANGIKVVANCKREDLRMEP